MAMDEPCERPFDLKPLSPAQEGVRKMKEHVAMDDDAEPPERRSRTHMAVKPLTSLAA